MYQRSSNPQNCAGHPSIKKILQYRKLIDELKLFDVKKLAKTEFNDVLVGDRPTSIKNKGFSTNLESSADKLNNVEPELGVGLLGTEAEKRKITYEMAKNKGLMPKRKKEQRNPRVKHREKFRKAKIRRKGQIRTPRTETQRYGGEMSGIKSDVTKSIKFK
ncbi:unnamed protein product [Allacma fusca]|uniref:Sas10 C-terminal domain-containing protein n=1 Tax=Allacma fusca TaxID=39272 RepID=A0A8J2L379_9HEXA|nr:unnamed protein product [Allacma fusca]